MSCAKGLADTLHVGYVAVFVRVGCESSAGCDEALQAGGMVQAGVGAGTSASLPSSVTLIGRDGLAPLRAGLSLSGD